MICFVGQVKIEAELFDLVDPLSSETLAYRIDHDSYFSKKPYT